MISIQVPKLIKYGKGSTTILVKRSRTQVIGVRNGALTIQNDCDEDIVYARTERSRGCKSQRRSSVLFFIFQNIKLQ